MTEKRQKRGDLVIGRKVNRAYAMVEGLTDTTESWYLLQVSAVYRDGHYAKRVRRYPSDKIGSPCPGMKNAGVGAPIYDVIYRLDDKARHPALLAVFEANDGYDAIEIGSSNDEAAMWIRAQTDAF